MSEQSSPRNYSEEDRVGAFRVQRQPADWAHNEIVQIDLPSGYRCHVVTRLSNYRFNGEGFTAETSYLGRTIRFAQMSTTIGGEALEDWKPVDANGKRCKLILPKIEYYLITNKNNRERLIFRGEGILRSTMGYSGDGSELTAKRSNYSRPVELKEWLIEHYQKKYSIPWMREGTALLRAIRAEHDRIIYMQSKDMSW